MAFLDDQSRFIAGYGLHATQSSALVIEVLRAAVAAHGAPREILTDNGAPGTGFASALSGSGQS